MSPTGHPWLDLVLAVIGSGTGSFGLGFYVGYRWGRRRPPGRHVARGETGNSPGALDD